MAQKNMELPLEPENYEEQCETLETEEINKLEEGDNLNVIPLQFINLDKELVDGTRIVQISSPKSLESDCFEAGGHRGKYYKQTYRRAWENMPDFKGWLKGVKGQPTRAYCTFCRKTLHAHRLSLLKHTCTIRHQKAAHYQTSEKEQNYNSMTPISLEGVLVPENEDVNDDKSENAYMTQEGLKDDEEHALLQDNIDSEECEYETVPAEEECVSEPTVPSQISTTVTDSSRGGSVSGLAVSLYKLVEGRWTFIDERLTDAMGRCSDFFNNRKFTPGRYKLHLDVDRYFESKNVESVFPFIEIIFDAGSSSKYHFPVLLGPNTYTTYRAFSD
ncbi:uncharacterized protein LOC126739384 [Anthonomus grandis grandis]|uniref:uncharacterized protein LOC126739384 n=1 Tax=Anthonomus grandis grandis TaxID=2921223 RepID=UPI002164F582|nr:uncharacterized protein LOC126739384 [Anthonomus grandis grandis]